MPSRRYNPYKKSTAGGNSFPLRRSQRTTLSYGAIVNLTGASTAVNHLFSGNSLHDPDVTGVGGQPAAYDELATLFQKYKVMGSRMNCTFLSGGAASGVGQKVCTIAYSQDVGEPALTTAGESLIDLGAKSVILGCRDSADGHKSITHQVGTSRIFGVKDLDDDGFSGSSGC